MAGFFSGSYGRALSPRHTFSSADLAPLPARRCPRLVILRRWSGCGERFDEREKRAHRRPGRAFRLPRRLVVEIGRPGDVEVDPRRLVDELSQERGGGQRAGGAAAGVLQVGDVALHLRRVVFVVRHLPVALAGGLGGRQGTARRRRRRS